MFTQTKEVIKGEVYCHVTAGTLCKKILADFDALLPSLALPLRRAEADPLAIQLLVLIRGARVGLLNDE